MNKKIIIASIIAIILVMVFIGGGLISSMFTSSNNPQDTTMQQQQATDQVQSQDTVVGSGDVAVAGKQVTVNYTGVFASTGKKFDSSLDREVPFTFTLGTGMV